MPERRVSTRREGAAARARELATWLQSISDELLDGENSDDVAEGWIARVDELTARPRSASFVARMLLLEALYAHHLELKRRERHPEPSRPTAAGWSHRRFARFYPELAELISSAAMDQAAELWAKAGGRPRPDAVTKWKAVLAIVNAAGLLPDSTAPEDVAVATVEREWRDWRKERRLMTTK